MKRLLYIEDNRAMQKVVECHLLGLAEVCLGATLREGRSLILTQPFDLLLADVYLPDGNSLDLVAELRRRYSPEQLPVILVSASMDRQLIIRGLQAGANECFSMPMSLPVLASAVAKMLDRPYVRPQDHGAVVVTWVEGTSGDQFWVYCPELDLRLDGAEREAVREEMAHRVRGALQANIALPFIGRLTATERLVEIVPPSVPSKA